MVLFWSVVSYCGRYVGYLSVNLLSFRLSDTHFILLLYSDMVRVVKFFKHSLSACGILAETARKLDGHADENLAWLLECISLTKDA